MKNPSKTDLAKSSRAHLDDFLTLADSLSADVQMIGPVFEEGRDNVARAIELLSNIQSRMATLKSPPEISPLIEALRTAYDILRSFNTERPGR